MGMDIHQCMLDMLDVHVGICLEMLMTCIQDTGIHVHSIEDGSKLLQNLLLSLTSAWLDLHVPINGWVAHQQKLRSGGHMK